jgi:hypothetical protein
VIGGPPPPWRPRGALETHSLSVFSLVSLSALNARLTPAFPGLRTHAIDPHPRPPTHHAASCFLPRCPRPVACGECMGERRRERRGIEGSAPAPCEGRRGAPPWPPLAPILEGLLLCALQAPKTWISTARSRRWRRGLGFGWPPGGESGLTARENAPIPGGGGERQRSTRRVSYNRRALSLFAWPRRPRPRLLARGHTHTLTGLAHTLLLLHTQGVQGRDISMAVRSGGNACAGTPARPSPPTPHQRSRGGCLFLLPRPSGGAAPAARPEMQQQHLLSHDHQTTLTHASLPSLSHPLSSVPPSPPSLPPTRPLVRAPPSTPTRTSTPASRPTRPAST